MKERSLFGNRLAAAVCALAMVCAAAFAPVGAARSEAPLSDLPAAAEPLCTDGMEAELLAALLAAHPDRVYEYTLPLCGQQVSSTQTALVLEGEVTQAMVQELKRWLPCLPALEQVDMYDADLPEEDMAYFHAAFPGIRFGWTLSLGKWTVRTDAQAFSTLQSQNSKRYDSTHFEKLRYCYQLRALDLGHNSLTDLSFLQDLPQLRVLILADNKIDDITPLAQLPELQYAELFMNRISDLSPLAGHTQLLDLNLTYNRVSDPSPLLTCTGLERIWIGHNRVERAQRKELIAAFPGGEIIYANDDTGSTGHGWRTHPRYEVIREIFRTGVYLPFEAVPAE